MYNKITLAMPLSDFVCEKSEDRCGLLMRAPTCPEISHCDGDTT